MPQSSAGDAVPPGARPEDSTVADALRPALQLWLVCSLIAGVEHTVFLCLPSSTEAHRFRDVLSHDLVLCGKAIFIAWFVARLRDPEVGRWWAPLPPRRLELTLFVGVVGVLLLAGWDAVFYGPGVSRDLLEQRELGWPFAASLLTVAVFPAIGEELLYRGLLQQRLSLVCGMPLAILVQSMLFALMHQSPSHLLGFFWFGLLTGVLRVLAGALWPCLLVHMLGNAWLVHLAWRAT